MKWLKGSPSISDPPKGGVKAVVTKPKMPSVRFHVFFASDEIAVKSWVRMLARARYTFLPLRHREELQFRLHRARLRGKYDKLFEAEMASLQDDQQENVRKSLLSGEFLMTMFGTEEM